MLGSKNDFFFRSEKSLKAIRRDVKTLLRIKGFDESEVHYFIVAYDYFVLFPSRYDGETLVKDLNDLHGLSLAGMVHDFEYVKVKVARNLIEKLKSDIEYAKNHEKLGKGYLIPYSRAILLILSTPFYYLLKLLRII